MTTETELQESPEDGPRRGARCRVCKICKFTTNDAKEFQHHTIVAHDESEEIQINSLENSTPGQSIAAKKAKKVLTTTKHLEINHSEKTDSTNSVDDSQNNHGDVNGFHGEGSNDEDDEEDGIRKVKAGNTRTYNCKDCTLQTTNATKYLHHQIEEHGYDFAIYECNMCSYATKYKQKLSRHVKVHLPNSVRQSEHVTETEILIESSEYSQEQVSLTDSSLSQNNYTDIPDGPFVTPEIPSGPFITPEIPNGPFITPDVPSGPFITPDNTTPSTTDVVIPGNAYAEELDENEDTDDERLFQVELDDDEDIEGLESNFKDAAKKKRSPRTEVEPWKYRPIINGDSVKYACSRCGNTYSWKKSVNKHWKEKHDGEGRPSLQTVLSIPNVAGRFTNASQGAPDSSAIFPQQKGNNQCSPNTSYNNTATTLHPVVSQQAAPSVEQLPSCLPVSTTSIFKPQNKLMHCVSRRDVSVNAGRMQEGRTSTLLSAKPVFTSKGPVLRQTNSMSPLLNPVATNVPSPSQFRSKESNFGSKSNTPSNIPSSLSALNQMVLTSPASAFQTQQMNVYNPEADVLDLSKPKPPAQFQVQDYPAEPQDEPLDFSKKPTVSTAQNTTHTDGEILGIAKQCMRCGFIAKDQNEFNEHVRKLHQMADQAEFTHNRHNAHQRSEFSCYVCGSRFSNAQELIGHFNTIHPSTPNPYEIRNQPAHQQRAPPPPYPSNRNQGLRTNREPQVLGKRDASGAIGQLNKFHGAPPQKKPTVRSSYICMECDFETPILSELTKHRMTFHTSATQKCSVCDFRSTFRSDLELHMRTTHGMTITHQRPPSQSLQEQMPVHTLPTTGVPATQKPAPEVIQIDDDEDDDGNCIDLQISNVTSLAQSNSRPDQDGYMDMQSIVSDSVVEDLACDRCSYQANNKAELAYHMKARHFESKYMRCPNCPFQATNVAGIVAHMAACNDSAGDVKNYQGIGGKTGNRKLQNIAPRPSPYLSPVSTTPSIPSSMFQNQKSPGQQVIAVFDRQGSQLSNGPPNVTVLAMQGSPQVLQGHQQSVSSQNAQTNASTNQMVQISAGVQIQSQNTMNTQPQKTQLPNASSGGVVWTKPSAVNQVSSPGMMQPQQFEYTGNSTSTTNQNVCSGQPILVSTAPPGKLPIPKLHPQVKLQAKLQQQRQTKPAMKRIQLPKTPKFTSIINAGQYHCLSCPFVGNTVTELKKHAYIHTDEKPYMCSSCNFKSKWKNDLKKHCEANSHIYSPTKARKNATSTEFDNMMQEMNMSEDEQLSSQSPNSSGVPKMTVYKCDQCQFMTCQKQNLEKHHLKAHSTDKPTNQKFRCKQCKYQASDLPDFLQHKRYCQLTSQTDGTQEVVSVQQNEVRKTQRRQTYYKCAKCPYKCFKRSGLELHEAMHEPRGADAFMCDYCDYNVYSMSLLVQHMKLHPEWHERTSQERTQEEETLSDAQTSSLPVESQSQSSDPNDAAKSPISNQAMFPIPIPNLLAFPPGLAEISLNLNSGYSATESENNCDLIIADPTPTQPEEPQDTTYPEMTEFDAMNAVRPKGRYAFACPRCPYRTKNKDNMDQHIPMHFKKSRFCCEWCDLSTSRLNILFRHAKCAHPVQVSGVGKKDFFKRLMIKSSKKYKKGIVDETGARLLPSFTPIRPKVDKRGSEKSQVQQLASGHPNGVTTAIHPQVENARVDLVSNEAHRTLSTMESPSEFIGEFQPLVAKTVTHLSQEKEVSKTVSAHQSSAPRILGTYKKKRNKFQCSKCSYFSDSIINIQRHIQKHGQRSKYLCKYCDYSLDRLNLLFQHLTGVHGCKNPKLSAHYTINKTPVPEVQNAAPVPTTFTNAGDDTEDDAMPENLSEKHQNTEELSTVNHNVPNLENEVDTLDGNVNNIVLRTVYDKPEENSVESNSGNSTSERQVVTEELLPRSLDFTEPLEGSTPPELSDDGPQNDLPNNNGQFDEELVLQSTNTMQKLDSFHENFTQEPDNKDIVEDIVHNNNNETIVSSEKQTQEKLQTFCTDLTESLPTKNTANTESQQNINHEISEKRFANDINYQNANTENDMVEKTETKNGDIIDASEANDEVEFNETKGPENLEEDLKKSETQAPMKKYRCTRCPFTTFKKESHLRHLEMHEYKGKYKCAYCNYSLDRVNLLYQHMKMHENIKDKSIESLKEKIQKRPIRVSHKPTGRPFNTRVKKELREGFYTEQRFNKVKTKQTKEVVVDETNIVTDPNARHPKLLQEAEIFKSGTRLRVRYKCQKCLYTTFCKSNIIKHRRQHTITGKYKCDICDYSAHQWRIIVMHKRYHTGGDSSLQVLPDEPDSEEQVVDDSRDEDKANENGTELPSTPISKPMGIGDESGPIQMVTVSENLAKTVAEHFAKGGSESNDTLLAQQKKQSSELAFSLKVIDLPTIGAPETALLGRKNRNYKCKQCPFSSNSSFEFRKHQGLHDSVMKYCCDYCSYSVDRLNLLYQHRHLHRSEPNFDENPPPEYLLNSEVLMMHQKKKKTAKKYIVKPPVSKPLHRFLENNPGVQRHGRRPKQSGFVTASFLQKRYPYQVKRYKCDQCPYKCNLVKLFTSHRKFHGANGKYICDFCNYSCMKQNGMTLHRKMHASQPGYIAQTDDRLLNRNYTPENNAEQQHMIFTDKGSSEFKQHTSEETNIRPGQTSVPLSSAPPREKKNRLFKRLYACTLCPYSADNKRSFAHHQELHTTPSKYKCEKCSYSVDRLNLMYQHLRLHQEGMNTTDGLIRKKKINAKRMKCSKCPHHTHSRTMLEHHMRMHNPGGKYTCSFCDYSIDRYNLMLQHLKVHKEEKKVNTMNNEVKELISSPNRENIASDSNIKEATPTTVVPKRATARKSMKKFKDKDQRVESPIVTVERGFKTEKSVSSGGRFYKCDRCPFTTTNKQNQQSHISQHGAGLKYKCQYCDYSCNKSYFMSKHINLHFPEGSLSKESLMQLTVCSGNNPMVQLTLDPKLQALARTSTIPSRAIPNTDISIVEEEQMDTNNDESETHVNKNGNYECQYCEREFENKETMQRHERQHLIGYSM